MSKIQIKTITPVHVGSGQVLQYGNDFVKGNYNRQEVFGIVDARKILEQIGEKNIGNWVALIQKGDSADKIVRLYSPNAKIGDYSSRMIANWVNSVKNTDTLRESIHDGFGRPYIPGSSIKGAIRTAVTSLLAKKEVISLDRLLSNGKISAENVEKKLFGGSPNSDAFRFLQVGDAFFDEYSGIATRMIHLNERERNSFEDESKSQIIEAISPGEISSFEIRLNVKLYNTITNLGINVQIHSFPDCMTSLSSLFSAINQHTLSLLISEQNYWKQKAEMVGQENIVKDYVDKIDDILKLVKKCGPGSCILRLGYGSGWRFITGGWSEGFDGFSDIVVPACRPKNDRYKNYSFPKSRRVDEECELMGFVQLNIVEE